MFSVAPHEFGIDGCVLITVRCATPDWPAADSILRTLKVLGRHGTTANDGEPLALPMIGEREEDD